jgi:hypothetical protein
MIAAVAVSSLAINACTSLTGGGSSSIDADAAAILKASCDKIAAAEQFTFAAKRTVDPELVEGRKVKLSARIDGAVKRPNKIYGRSSDSTSTMRFYYDGADVTLYDETAGHYAVAAGGSSIDKTIDKIAEKFNFTPPLADLLVGDPYRGLSRRAKSGKLVGTGSVNGVKCQHIILNHDAIDVDVWIATKDSLPRRFVITFKETEGNPQLKADLTRWNLNANLADSKFDFTPPKDAQKIDMVPVN